MWINAGLEARTNHSLQATAATALLKVNVPERKIQERTGHRSIATLRLHERSNEFQHCAASRNLVLGKEVEYHKAFCPVSPSQEKASKETATGNSMVTTTGLPITHNLQSMTGCNIIPWQSTRDQAKALWHYRISQQKRSKNLSATSDFPITFITMPWQRNLCKNKYEIGVHKHKCHTKQEVRGHGADRGKDGKTNFNRVLNIDISNRSCITA